VNRFGKRLAVLQGQQLGTLGISRFDIRRGRQHQLAIDEDWGVDQSHTRSGALVGGRSGSSGASLYEEGADGGDHPAGKKEEQKDDEGPEDQQP